MNPTTKYTASTVSFEYEQGIEDGYEIFTDGRRPPEIKPRVKSLKTLTRNFIRGAKPEVETDVDGRIVRESGGTAAPVPSCP